MKHTGPRQNRNPFRRPIRTRHRFGRHVAQLDNVISHLQCYGRCLFGTRLHRSHRYFGQQLASGQARIDYRRCGGWIRGRSANQGPDRSAIDSMRWRVEHLRDARRRLFRDDHARSYCHEESAGLKAQRMAAVKLEIVATGFAMHLGILAKASCIAQTISRRALPRSQFLPDAHEIVVAQGDGELMKLLLLTRARH